MKTRTPGDPMRKRQVHSLSLGANFSIQPEEWVGIAGKKEFDATSTRILRVFRHRDGSARWMVYGMRAAKADGKKTADKSIETYEFVAAAELLPAAVNKVATHCGIESMLGDVGRQLP